MLLEAIYHRPKQNWAYAYDNQTIFLRIRTAKGDVSAIEVIAGDKYAWHQTVCYAPMTIMATDAQFDYWEVAFQPPFRRMRYAFKLIAQSDFVLLTDQGFEYELPDYCNSFFDFPFINPVDVFTPPAWVKDAVFYQIFPERFANGNPSISPKNVEPWGGTPKYNNFFGGDLQGVIDHLDHLTELGVNAVYFTPLFEATTNHKYDTRDYLKVDPHFGTNEKLKELVELCHARGIRIMLDAVFNHSGRTFEPFLDAQKHGKASKYADWFHVRQWPLEVINGVPSYETFAFEPLMPKLNTENAEVKAYLLEVARYWLEEVGIDGWRLDVANEVDHQFWREFRTVVKAVNSEAYIVGEIWHDSIMWLQGDQFDAVMNYPMTNAVLDFIAREKIDGATFTQQISKQLAAYPRQVTETSFNVLDSHDTPRLLTVCDEQEEKLKLAVLYQLTTPGVPCIYYGDEVGMKGENDPYCRGCMVWDKEKQNRELFAFYQETIQLRHSYSALKSTNMAFLYRGKQEDGVVIYAKWDESEQFIIVLNGREQANSITFLTDALLATSTPYDIEFRGFETPSVDEKVVATETGVHEAFVTSPPPYSFAKIPVAKSVALQSTQEQQGEWSVVLSNVSQLPKHAIVTEDDQGKLTLKVDALQYIVLKRNLK